MKEGSRPTSYCSIIWRSTTNRNWTAVYLQWVHHYHLPREKTGQMMILHSLVHTQKTSSAVKDTKDRCKNICKIDQNQRKNHQNQNHPHVESTIDNGMGYIFCL